MIATTPDRQEAALKTQKIKISDLSPYYKNARRGNVDAIAESLQVNGQYKPIVVNEGAETGRPWEVLVGNHTVQAAKQIGLEELDAVVIDVDDARARRIVLADNRTSDLASYDDAVLADLLSDAGDLLGTGFTDVDLGGLLSGGAPGAADFIDPPEEDAYKPQYAVTVVCEDEEQQQSVYEELHGKGYDVRVVAV